MTYEAKEKRFQPIIDNMINGNLSDFRSQIKKLSKSMILDLIEFASGNGILRHEIINRIRIALEN